MGKLYSIVTDGLFDIKGAFTRLYKGHDDHKPGFFTRLKAKKRVNARDILSDEDKGEVGLKKKGEMIDLNSIAKGYWVI